MKRIITVLISLLPFCALAAAAQATAPAERPVARAAALPAPINTTRARAIARRVAGRECRRLENPVTDSRCIRYGAERCYRHVPPQRTRNECHSDVWFDVLLPLPGPDQILSCDGVIYFKQVRSVIRTVRAPRWVCVRGFEG